MITIETDTVGNILDENQEFDKRRNQLHITYGYFEHNSRDEYVFMFTKQCFIISNKIYKIQDIYGYEDNENGSFFKSAISNL